MFPIAEGRLLSSDRPGQLKGERLDVVHKGSGQVEQAGWMTGYGIFSQMAMVIPLFCFFQPRDTVYQ